VEDYVALCDGEIKGLRVAWSADFGYAAVDPRVREITTEAAQTFAELGCSVEEATPTWQNPAGWAGLLWDYNTFIRNVARADERPEWIEPSMREQIEHGRSASAVEVGQALLERTVLYERMREFMERYDLLVSPQMPCPAWGYDTTPTAIGGRSTPTMFDRLPFTFPFNLTGWPAASVPCGFTSEGLPVALQIVASWRQDALCLRAAAAFEQARPWAQHRPPLDA
jgi:aspartyl-tRNA(Asn)/glutamyl-tRNA(Gln) amidotransferase subunit A